MKLNITTLAETNFSPTQLPGFSPGFQTGYEQGLAQAANTISEFIYILALISMIYLLARFILNRVEFKKEVRIERYSIVLTPEKLYYTLTDIFYTVVLGITGFLLSVQILY